MKNLGLYIPEYQNLSRTEKVYIRDFCMIWSIFELKSFSTRCNAGTIGNFVNGPYRERLTENRFWTKELQYFRDRYAGERPYGTFDSLNFRRLDNKDLVRHVIFDNDNNLNNELIALLIIVYRLRNNLFHGLKWHDNGMRNQKENFKNSISIMCKILDLNLPQLEQN